MKKFYMIKLLLLAQLAYAQEQLPDVFTYQGRAFQSDGITPLTGTATFSVQIRSSNGTCLLYQETHSGVDLTASSGFFALNIGEGTAKSGLSFSNVFHNQDLAKTTLSGTCGGNYTPLNQEARVLRVTVNVGGGPIALDDQFINTVPQALVANTLNGYSSKQFVQSLTTTERNNLTSMVNGTTIYNITTGRFNRYDGSTWTEAFGATNVGTGSGVYKQKSTGTDWLEFKSIVAGTGISVTGNTNDVTIAVNTTNIQARVTGSCTSGNYIRAIAADGTVTCDTDATGSGTVTTDNDTISGNGSSGSPLAVAEANLDIANMTGDLPYARLQTCSNDQILKMNGTSWNCEAEAGGSVSVSHPVTGDGTSGTPLGIARDGTTIVLNGSNQLAVGSISSTHIGDDQVTAAKIADGAIDAFAKIADLGCGDGQIIKWSDTPAPGAWACANDSAGTALPSMTDAQIIVSNGTTPAAVSMSGDAAISNTGVLTIANGAVETAMIGDEQVTYAKIQDVTTSRLLGRASAGAGVIEEITLGTGLSFSGTTLNVSGSSPVGSTLSNGAIWVGNGSNEAAAVTISGDASISNTGALTIANGAVEEAMIASGAVSLPKIAACGADQILVMNVSGNAWTCGSLPAYGDISEVTTSATSGLSGGANSGAVALQVEVDGATIGINGSNDLAVLNSGITYAKIQNVSATNMLLGRASAGAGVVEEITLGTGLSISGTTLNVTAGSGAPYRSGGDGTNPSDYLINTTLPASIPTGAAYNLVIGRNALRAINDNAADQNTIVGHEAGYKMTSGSFNTAFGTLAGYRMTTGTNNTAIGTRSMSEEYTSSLTGNYNTAVGSYSMTNVSSGSDNVGVGFRAADGIKTGSQNVAVGSRALQQDANSPGSDNVAVGHYALRSIGGSNNIGIGTEAGQSVTTSHNISIGSATGGTPSVTGYNLAVGNNSLQNNKGGHNTAVGYFSLQQLGDGATAGQGQYNVAVGSYAGTRMQGNSNNNTVIGYQAAYNGSAYETGWTGNVIIGYQAGPTTAAALSNKLIINNSRSDSPLIYGDFSAGSVTINGAGGLTVGAYYYSSDRRLKENIQDLESPLEKILKLRSVSFDWKDSGKHDIGFIAQEVEDVFPDLVGQNEKGIKSVKYGNIVAPLVGATQELHRMCEMSKEQIAAVAAKVESHDRRIASLEAENKVLKQRLEKQEKLLQQILKKLK